MPRKYDISVVVTAHHEGRLAHHTMRSLNRAVKFAQSKGITCEIVVILDKPDPQTAKYFSTHHASNARLDIVQFGDLGLSRNHGRMLAEGKYVAFLDADNLFAEDWISKIVSYLDSVDEDVVVHPEYHVVFEGNNLIWRQISSNSREFIIENLIEQNYWDAVCASKKNIFEMYPYETTTGSPGFGFEDWHFNCQTLASCIQHHIIPETVHFLRVKTSGSLLAYSVHSNRTIRPTKLFCPVVLSDIITNNKNRHISYTITEKFEKFNNFFSTEIARKLNKIVVQCKKKIRLILSAICKHSPPIKKFASLLLSNKLISASVDILQPNVSSALKLPQWLLEEWEKIHQIEPKLFPEKSILESTQIYQIGDSRIGRYYLDLCSLYGDDGISHVFLIPWLKRGGAELVTLNYINALTEARLANGITVISTFDSDSPWLNRLPDGVRFVEFGRKYNMLTEEEREKLLLKLLIQMAPRVVHNINSELGYKVFVKYGKALSSVSQLYASSFCRDVSDEGKDVGYPFSYLPECFDYLHAVFSDNRSFLDRLQELYAFDRHKLITHYQPCSIIKKRDYIDRIAQKRSIDILWAGRIDRQKRPDILTAIATECCGLPFQFHVYGSPVLDRDIYTSRLRQLDNVALCGGYDGLSSLPIEKFDLLLYTSQWDGLPNVILEAISLGLPVVASNSGAVNELIYPNETGFLIEPYDDVSAFVACLTGILQDSSMLSRFVANAYEIIQTRHSLGCFIEGLSSVDGYVAK